MRGHRFSVVLIAFVALALIGCTVSQQVSPFDDHGRAWPAPPDAARIQYVTQFSGPADLGIRPSFLTRLVGMAAGSEGGTMLRPMSVVATPDGQIIYVADPDARCVHRFDLGRGRYDCLTVDPEGMLLSPVGLAIAPDGKIFVADSAMDVVLVASQSDKGLQPLALTPAPEQPTGLAIAASGELFVTSTASHTVRRYDPAGRLVREYGGRGSGSGEMNFPTYLWLGLSTELLVTDTMNFRVQRLDTEDGVLGMFGKAGDGTGSLARPKGVAMDRHGHIYVMDGMHHAMQIFNREGQLLLAVGEQGQSAGQFWLPGGVFVTAEGLIFVADSYNRRVQVFRYVGDES
jgi:DNA-binding beta-propeller fold protein YncE